MPIVGTGGGGKTGGLSPKRDGLDGGIAVVLGTFTAGFAGIGAVGAAKIKKI